MLWTSGPQTFWMLGQIRDFISVRGPDYFAHWEMKKNFRFLNITSKSSHIKLFTHCQITLTLQLRNAYNLQISQHLCMLTGAARLDGLQPSLKKERQKIPPNCQTRLKFGFSYEISQHNHFRYFRYHFGSTFSRNPTKPMFRNFATTPLVRWRFEHTCR